MHRALRLAVISVLFFSTGAPWVFLQGIAWARMTVQRVGSDGVAAAVRSAADGRRPCSMCLAARRGASETQKRQATGARSGAIDFAVTSVPRFPRTDVVVRVDSKIRFDGTQTIPAVDVPPPDVLPA